MLLPLLERVAAGSRARNLESIQFDLLLRFFLRLEKGASRGTFGEPEAGKDHLLA